MYLACRGQFWREISGRLRWEEIWRFDGLPGSVGRCFQICAVEDRSSARAQSRTPNPLTRFGLGPANSADLALSKNSFYNFSTVLRYVPSVTLATRSGTPFLRFPSYF